MTSKPVLDICPPTKRKSSNTTNVSACLFRKKICNEQHTYTQKQWEALRLTAKERTGLDRYGFVYSEVDWEKGTQDEQSFFHRKCIKNMQTRSKLLQAKCRRDKLTESSSLVCTIKPSNSDIKQTAARSPSSFSIIPTTTIVKPSESPEQISVNTTFAPKRMTLLSSGKLFDKGLCMWCMEPDESIKKKKKISQNRFNRLEQKKSWRHICVCTPFLTDKEMRDRTLAIIALFPKDDPFAPDIHYHKRCWDKYISSIKLKKRRDK